MHRDLGYYWIRLAIYVALASGLGSVYYKLGNTYSSINVRVIFFSYGLLGVLKSVIQSTVLLGKSCYNFVQARGSMLIFVATVLTLMTIGGFPSFMEEMKVSRSNHFWITFFHKTIDLINSLTTAYRFSDEKD